MVGARKRDIKQLLIVLAVMATISIISVYFFTRVDFTQEKRYTLSGISRSEIQSLDHDVYIVVYLNGDFPAGFKRLQSEVTDILGDYKAYAKGRLHISYIDPSAGTADDNESLYQDLSNKGLIATNLSVKTAGGLTQRIIFPGALVHYQGKTVAVNFLQNKMGASPEEVLNNSIQNLEYALTSAIHKIRSGEAAMVGFTEGHGELSDNELADAMGSLEGQFKTGRVLLSGIDQTTLNKLKLLIVPKPQAPFSEADKFKIDRFVMSGGSILWAIDNVNASLDSLKGRGEQLSFGAKLNLDDQLFTYGARVNYDLIQDMNCAQIPLTVGRSGEQPQIQLVPWLYDPLLMPVSRHPLVKNLDAVRTEFVSSLDTIGVKGIRKDILLSSSPYSKVVTVPGIISLETAAINPNPNDFRSSPHPVAVLLQGAFASVFANRPVPAGLESISPLPSERRVSKMIVVSDGDILRNQVNKSDGSPFPLGFDRYTGQQYGNKNFFLNAVDVLTDDIGLISLRNKELKIRMLDRTTVQQHKLRWQLINVLSPLALLTLAALLHFYYRKIQYSRPPKLNA